MEVSPSHSLDEQYTVGDGVIGLAVFELGYFDDVGVCSKDASVACSE